MIYSILTLVCLLSRGQSSLQNKTSFIDMNSNSSSDTINGENGLNISCGIEELSKLLSDKMAMNKAIELASSRQSKSREEFVKSILDFAFSPSDDVSDEEAFNHQNNEIHRIAGNINTETIVENNSPILTNHLEIGPPPLTPMPPMGRIHPYKEPNEWSFEPYLKTFSPYLPQRNIKLPPGAKIKLEFNDKKREVSINVSPLMTVIEALKQAEIKFKRNFKLSSDEELISFWLSPTMGCVIVDRVSKVQNDDIMMWEINIVNNKGESEWHDFCLPSNGELFVRPGMTVQLVYTSVQNFKDYY